MSIHVTSRIWQSGRYRHSTLLLLLAMADFADDDGMRIYPAAETLARKARVDTRTARRLLAQLEAEGAIAVVEARPSQPVHYRIVLEHFDEAAPGGVGEATQDDAPAGEWDAARGGNLPPPDAARGGK